MSETEIRERDYVLGTHDEEIERLGLQHRVWRPQATAAWQRAGFTVGQTLIDLGSGPGYASIDLAEIVGPSGKVVAIDRSRRFLDTLESRARERGLTQVQALELDLDEGALPTLEADGAWARWVLAFVRRPKELLVRVHGALRPGATLVLHEYLHYTTWRMAPRCKELETFVAMVVESWRESGGEPDVGLDLPHWLGSQGFAVERIVPLVSVVRPQDYAWQWPQAFINSGLRRMVTLGKLSRDQQREMERAIAAACAHPHATMVQPMVVEVIARRV